ncbi:hypothetical protein [Lichenibacterium minor]|uniref:hypothetical protein n=1 Tax=Lichenibacterium minor TaxID=2316528 RepID=UPI001FE000F1|nr:hypothetical protein [Lichenibacterium minor]
MLAQEATGAKSNETPAIPLRLERLELAGAVVTIDAMGRQTRIAQKILDIGFYGSLCRLGSGNGLQHMATVRHIALDLMQGPKDEHGLEVQRKSAAWDDACPGALIHRTV